MLVLSNLLRNPVIRPETMEALGEGREIERSNKDLGRVEAICNIGLLAARPVTPEQFRRVAERVVVDAIEPLAEIARAGTEGL